MAPEAFDVTEAFAPQHSLVRLGGLRDQDALEREPLPVDLLLRVPVRPLEVVVVGDQEIVGPRTAAEDLFDRIITPPGRTVSNARRTTRALCSIGTNWSVRIAVTTDATWPPTTGKDDRRSTWSIRTF